MKILYISRLFTGLEQTVLEKKWIPTGVPTIYKVIEALDSQFDLFLVFNQKIGYYRNKKFNYGKININGIKNNVVLNRKIRLNIFPKKINIIITELYHLIKSILIVIKIRPDIIYIDNANVISASFFSRLSNIPICLRIMGVYPVMKSYYESNDLISKFYKYLYSSPFNLIIGTQDGTGTEFWLDQAANKKTIKKILINGVNKISKNDFNNIDSKKDKIHVGFIGKLEKAKGAELFIDSCINYLKKRNDIKFYVVGSGSLFNFLNKKVRNLNLDNSIKFYEYLEHAKVYELLKKLDIYVSLNKYGNLSNTNLEAISSEKAMIILNSDLKTKTDIFVDSFIPDNAVYRIDRNDIVNSLVNALTFFSKNPEKLLFYSKNISLVSKKLKSWENRIEEEINLLKILNKKKRI